MEIEFLGSSRVEVAKRAFPFSSVSYKIDSNIFAIGIFKYVFYIQGIRVATFDAEMMQMTLCSIISRKYDTKCDVNRDFCIYSFYI